MLKRFLCFTCLISVGPAMADSPPPLDDVDFKSEEEVEVSGEPSEKAKPEPEAVEEEPLFAEMEKPEEPKKEEPKEEEPVEAEHITIIPAPTLEATAVEESPEPEPVVKPKVESAPAPSKPLDEDLFGEDENKTEEEVWRLHNAIRVLED